MEPKIVAYISCGITLVFTLVTLFLLLFGWIHKNRISEYNSHAAIFFYISVGALGFLTFLKPIRKTFSILFPKNAKNLQTRTNNNMANMKTRFTNNLFKFNNASAKFKSNIKTRAASVASAASAATVNGATSAVTNANRLGSTAWARATNLKRGAKSRLQVGGDSSPVDLTPLQEMLQEGIPPFSNLVGVVSIRDLIVPNNILTVILAITFGLFLLLVAITHLFPTWNPINIERGESNKLSYIATTLLAGLIIYMTISIFGGASKGFAHLSEGHTFLTVIATIFKVIIILFIAMCSCGPAIAIIQPEVNLNMIISKMPSDTIAKIRSYFKNVGAAEANL